tara:strand:+ start:182 stop:550 length:369 start_codon:yes stop_codon:yes gene_type:complete
MITDEKISDIVKGIVMLLTGLITEPMTELSNMVETVKATTDRLTADMLELHSEIESKINLAISNIETCPVIEEKIAEIEQENYELKQEVDNIKDSLTDIDENATRAKDALQAVNMALDEHLY